MSSRRNLDKLCFFFVSKPCFGIPRHKTMQNHCEITSKSQFWNRAVQNLMKCRKSDMSVMSQNLQVRAKPCRKTVHRKPKIRKSVFSGSRNFLFFGRRVRVYFLFLNFFGCWKRKSGRKELRLLQNRTKRIATTLEKRICNPYPNLLSASSHFMPMTEVGNF